MLDRAMVTVSRSLKQKGQCKAQDKPLDSRGDKRDKLAALVHVASYEAANDDGNDVNKTPEVRQRDVVKEIFMKRRTVCHYQPTGEREQGDSASRKQDVEAELLHSVYIGL